MIAALVVFCQRTVSEHARTAVNCEHSISSIWCGPSTLLGAPGLGKMRTLEVKATVQTESAVCDGPQLVVCGGDCVRGPCNVTCAARPLSERTERDEVVCVVSLQNDTCEELLGSAVQQELKAWLMRDPKVSDDFPRQLEASASKSLERLQGVRPSCNFDTAEARWELLDQLHGLGIEIQSAGAVV
eukprot:TRINITY_DN6457_c0_g1_i1.p1 TRINITY_DN6457_c0_g1~~TRINITY_DN6457_c0_g1_i1.p1  ORF type:complete len:186 (+),score=35.14 TRINITY_DN6457_c0_g1_i1:77-634(+)